MRYSYKIRNGEIFEYSVDNNGKDHFTPTGVKAFYTKKEIGIRYGWGRSALRTNLLDPGIARFIYDRRNGEYITRKKVFRPAEMEIIFNYFGLP